jgi:hypothetical protein
VTRLQKVILTIGVVVALALAGVGVYASTGETTFTQGECLEQIGIRGRCVEYDEPTVHEPALDEDSAPLWWFGAAAAVVLTALGLVLARPTRPPA